MIAAAPTSVTNPFVGIRSFEPSESLLFHGRKQHTQQLLRLLALHRFVGVIGTSGSGKSSLVKAGLLPALHRGYLRGASSRWKTAIIRPGADPIERLAEALADPKGFAFASPAGTLAGRLEESSAALAAAARDQFSTQPEPDNLLLVVDQFEEIFRLHAGDDASRQAAFFVALLLRAKQEIDVPLYIVLTMRSEFLGDCAQFSGLAEALSEAQYLIPRLTREQREEAIRGPLDIAGVAIDDALVQRVLNDAGDDPDQLPALQHALMKLYEARGHTGHLRLADYQEKFQVGASLDFHAQSIYTDILNPAEREAAERVFRALTTTEAGREIRRPKKLGGLYAVAGANSQEEQSAIRNVIAAFARKENSLLFSSSGVSLEPGSLIDITHESLIRQWKLLKQWVRAEAESADSFSRLVSSAERYAQGKGGLWGKLDTEVAVARRNENTWTAAWGDQYCPGRFQEAIGFLEACQAEIETLEREKVERARELEQARERELRAAQDLAVARQQELVTARKNRNKLLVTIGALIVGLTIAIYFYADSRAQKERAQALQKDAEVQRTRAQAAEADARAKQFEIQALQATGAEKTRLEKEAADYRAKSNELEIKAKTEQARLQSATDAAAKQISDLQAKVSAAATTESELNRQLTQARRERDEALKESKTAPNRDEYNRLKEESDRLKRELAGLREQSNKAGPSTPALGGKSDAPKDKAGDKKVNPRDGLTYVFIPPGKFTMGCSPGDKECRPDERPAHEVEITKGFWIGQTEVTQAAYEKVTKTNPSYFKGADRPVENVSWGEAKSFCEAASLRLPTEAEWEYAARAGSKEARYGPLDQIAWYGRNSKGQTQPVAAKAPNAWGLYDMLGNVWEWVSDRYGQYSPVAARDPAGPASGAGRVVRGGSWNSVPEVARATIRFRIEPTYRVDDIGLRCAGELP